MYPLVHCSLIHLQVKVCCVVFSHVVVDFVCLFVITGDRFYAFLHHFSLYVLIKVMHRDHGKCSISLDICWTTALMYFSEI